MKIALVSDSVAYLSAEEVATMQISLLPLSIEFENKIYVEDEDLTPTEFYHLVRGANTLPKSSQPSIGQTMALFEQLQQQNYDAVIAVTLSSEISGTYQTVQSLDGEFGDMKIYVVDSRRAAAGEAYLVKRAYHLMQQGKHPEAIVADLNEMITMQNAYFIVDDLNHLQKGGRLSASSAFIGGMLNIKPILTIDGTISAAEKVRSMKKGLNRVSELMQQHVEQFPNVSFIGTIHHANALDAAVTFKQQLEQAHPTVTFEIVEFGQTIGTHLGEGALGVFFNPDPMKL